MKKLKETRKCLHCQKEFNPHLYFQKQRYCSRKCQYYVYNRQYNKTHNMSKYRHKDNCAKCGEFRRIRKKDRICESCINIEKYGTARKPNKGNCKVCKRGPLTLAAGKCKSCYEHGEYKGKGKTLSHGEALLRKRVSEIYSPLKVEHNFRPPWLRRQTSKVSMEFDVAVPENKIGFEYDGRPHCDPNHPGFFKSLRNDRAKIQIARDHGWTLIKIRSTDLVKSPSTFSRILDQIDQHFEYDSPPPKETNKTLIFSVG